MNRRIFVASIAIVLVDEMDADLAHLSTSVNSRTAISTTHVEMATTIMAHNECTGYVII
jgi:hypothetical protein